MDTGINILEQLLQTPGAQLISVGIILLVIAFVVVIIGGLAFAWRFLPIVLEARKQGFSGEGQSIMNTLLDQHGRTVSLLETKMEDAKKRDEMMRQVSVNLNAISQLLTKHDDAAQSRDEVTLGMLSVIKDISSSVSGLTEESRISMESIRNSSIDHFNSIVGKLDTVQAEALQILGNRIDSAEKNLLSALQDSLVNGSPIIIGVFTANQDGMVVWANKYAQKMFEGVVGSNVHNDEAFLVDVNGNQIPRENHPISSALLRCEAPSPMIIGVKYNHSQELLWVLMNVEIVFQNGICTGAVVTTASISSVLSAMGVALTLS